MRLRVAEGRDAQLPPERRNHLNAIVTALPTRHGERHFLHRQSERPQCVPQPIHRLRIRHGPGHPSAKIITQPLKKRMRRR
jgi:hypothetical protein